MTMPKTTTTQTMALFPLGSIVATPNAIQELDKLKIDPRELLHRHITGDWGGMPQEDETANYEATRLKNRVFSSFRYSDQQFYVITEADRSVTTILLPEDY